MSKLDCHDGLALSLGSLGFGTLVSRFGGRPVATGAPVVESLGYGLMRDLPPGQRPRRSRSLK